MKRDRESTDPTTEHQLLSDYAEAESHRTSRPARLWLVTGLFLAVLLLVQFTGLGDILDADRLRAAVKAAGPPWLGLLLFVAVFAVGILLHLPGMLFVVTAILIWGGVAGYLIALASALIAVSFTFFVVRAVGGKALHGVETPWVRRALDHLDERPVSTIALLRIVLWMSPPVNYALALTSVSAWQYLFGSLLGLLVPVTGAAVLLEWFL